MIEFVQANGASLVVVMFMLVVIGVGLRARESSCGMTMHQHVRQPPADYGREPRMNEMSPDPTGSGSTTPPTPGDASRCH